MEATLEERAAVEAAHAQAPAPVLAQVGTQALTFNAGIIPVTAIIAGYNPREYFDPTELASLTAQIKQNGSIDTPILVRDLGNGFYKLIAGERRLRGTKDALGDDAGIPARIFAADDPRSDTEIATVENTQRQQMSEAEEAKAAAKMLGECNGDRDEVAARLGMSRQMLDRRLALMNCTDKVLSALAHRKIKLGHAELLAGVRRDSQDKTLEWLLSSAKMPTVDECRAIMEKNAGKLDVAIFDTADCAACNHNSDMQRAMFADVVAAGCCTNKPCYEAKTQAVIQARFGELEGEFPVRRIVRPGDNFSVIPLRIEGEKGVGPEQAAACKACKSFGAAVMDVPDALGKVVKNVCFDVTCNSKMVAKALKAKADSAAATKSGGAPAGKAQAAGSASGGASKGKGQPNAPKAALTAVPVRGDVEAYRKKLWRDALRAEALADVAKASRVLLAGALCGQAGNIKGRPLAERLQEMSGMSVGKEAKIAAAFDVDMAQVLVALDGLKPQQRSLLTQEMVASMVEDMSDDKVVKLLNFFETNLSKHFKLGEDFLKTLTKSEIEVMVKDIGLDQRLGDLKKLMALKKPEIHQKVLGVAGFDYTTVPSFLSLEAKLS